MYSLLPFVKIKGVKKRQMMKVSKLPLIILGVLLFGQVQTTVQGNANSDPVDVSKRILLEDNYHEIIQKLDTLTKEVAALKAQTVNRPSTPVVFLAKLTQQVTGSGHHIYFDQVDLNMGNAYNPHHGTFVAPVNGTYLFFLKACSNGGHVIVLDLMVNATRVERMLAGDTDYLECSSTMVNVHLTSGDDVFVKQAPLGDLMTISSDYGSPLFTGVLLQTD